MPRSRVPEPRELGHWLAAAATGPVSGRYRYDGDGEAVFGWFGSPPVIAQVPVGEELRFWHSGPDRWRLEHGDELLAVSDGRWALARDDGEWVRGRSLVVLLGPQDLLRPEPPQRLPYGADGWREDDWAVDGQVLEVAHAGRRAWRWTRPEEVWVVDHDTGVALSHQDRRGQRTLTALQEHDELDPELFAVPQDLLALSRLPRTQLAPELLAEVGQERADRMVAETEARSLREDVIDDSGSGLPEGPGEWTSWPVAVADPVPAAAGAEDRGRFVVAWWPRSAVPEVVSGDPDIPEVLMRLSRDEPELLLGVTRAGREAPAQAGRAVHRWSGDGWAFALSHPPATDPAVVARIAESVPTRWQLP